MRQTWRKKWINSLYFSLLTGIQGRDRFGGDWHHRQTVWSSEKSFSQLSPKGHFPGLFCILIPYPAQDRNRSAAEWLPSSPGPPITEPSCDNSTGASMGKMLIEQRNVPVVWRATGAAQGYNHPPAVPTAASQPQQTAILPPSRTYEVWIGGDRDRVANDGYLWMTRLAAFVPTAATHGAKPRFAQKAITLAPSRSLCGFC
jgi:hypothetical protein